MILLIKTVENSTDSQSTTVDVYSGRRNIWFKNEATSRIGFSNKTPSPNNLIFFRFFDDILNFHMDS